MERLLVEVLVAVYNRMQVEDRGQPLSAQGRLDLEAAAPGIVRELGPTAIARLEAMTDDGVCTFLRSRIEPAFRRAVAETGIRPS
jgi:hypothetical protein